MRKNLQQAAGTTNSATEILIKERHYSIKGNAGQGYAGGERVGEYKGGRQNSAKK